MHDDDDDASGIDAEEEEVDLVHEVTDLWWILASVARFLKTLPHLGSQMGLGVSCAALGFYAGLRSKPAREIVLVVARKSTWIYGLMLIPSLLLAPVLLLVPSVLISVLTSVPLWAFHSAHAENPKMFNNMFLDEVKKFDANLFKKMKARLDEGPGIVQHSASLYHRLRRSSRYAFYSILLTLLGLVPLLTLFSAVAQVFLVSERFTWNLLRPYMQLYKKWSYIKQREVVGEHWYTMISFGLPFVFFGSIPFVGAFTIACAQAGAAHIVTVIRESEKLKKEAFQ